jgi:3-deoxy-D-manno-octulosonic-acid transferase
MLALYSLALFLVLIIGAPWWLFRMATSGKYREGLTERLGRVPTHITTEGKSVIWVHAVSVGEVLAASRLIDELAARAPSWRVVVSTTTRTGQQIARERFGANRVFYFPLDFAFAVRAWLRALQPRMVVLLETEFWPRFLSECRRASIPVAVVNARISDRSWPRYLRLRFLWKRLLNSFALVLAQSDLDAERLEAIGASNVRVGGNLKFGIRVDKPAPATEALRRHLPAGAKIVVCGSTLAGEEEALLTALPPDVVTILAPRHPERFSAVAQLLSQRKAPFFLRSRWMESPSPIAPGTIFLLDSIGELASVYSLADLAFVGGGLFTPGGHNPLEPAQFGVPILMGTHYENFRGIVQKLSAANAIALVDIPELAPTLRHLLASQSAAREMGLRARTVFESEAGATETAVEALLTIAGVDEAVHNEVRR